jgi:hypothetical protein
MAVVPREQLQRTAMRCGRLGLVQTVAMQSAMRREFRGTDPEFVSA